MLHAPADLVHRLRQHGQDHVLAGWDTLDTAQRVAFVGQLAGVQLVELEHLYLRRNESPAILPSRDRVSGLPVEDDDAIPASARAMGEQAIRNGEVAVLLLAGGQGSRLGFEKPKGMYPIGPVTRASLFQIHAEKVLALSRRYGRRVPFLVMTSPATHSETEAFFHGHKFFGLDSTQVTFFQQGTMPALDFSTGRLLLEKPGSLCLSPNGHGGTLTALADTGLLTDLKADGIRHIFYFQVDNPLVRVADPGFVGRHIEVRSEVSSKVVFKERPEERVGVLAQVDGRKAIIEYSDLPPSMAAERDRNGDLVFRAGNTAIHLFEIAFLERVTSGTERLPYHVARKKIPFYDPTIGEHVVPVSENALKAELFMFDALPLAERWLAVNTRRENEFAPLKNATGTDSPTTCQQLQVNLAGQWLEQSGIAVPRDTDGNVTVAIEMRPTFALDAAECAAKLPAGFQLTDPTLLK